MKKILARQLILKKYSCYGLKKLHTRNLITKKISCGSKIPPPHSFSNGPFLKLKLIVNKLITNDETRDDNNNRRATT